MSAATRESAPEPIKYPTLSRHPARGRQAAAQRRCAGGGSARWRLGCGRQRDTPAVTSVPPAPSGERVQTRPGQTCDGTASGSGGGCARVSSTTRVSSSSSSTSRTALQRCAAYGSVARAAAFQAGARRAHPRPPAGVARAQLRGQAAHPPRGVRRREPRVLCPEQAANRFRAAHRSLPGDGRAPSARAPPSSTTRGTTGGSRAPQSLRPPGRRVPRAAGARRRVRSRGPRPRSARAPPDAG
jgi:hypothetical protein